MQSFVNFSSSIFSGVWCDQTVNFTENGNLSCRSLQDFINGTKDHHIGYKNINNTFCNFHAAYNWFRSSSKLSMLQLELYVKVMDVYSLHYFIPLNNNSVYYTFSVFIATKNCNKLIFSLSNYSTKEIYMKTYCWNNGLLPNIFFFFL